MVREETERLNTVIQNLLDATRISADALRPRFEWAEVADIVNAALQRHRARLDRPCGRSSISPAELPLAYVDQNLIEQALGHVIENADEVFPARLADPHRGAGRGRHARRDRRRQRRRD